MQRDPDYDRIRRKAHELWEAEGHPHGRDQDHWDQAREIIAIEDSHASTLLPRDTGAQEPVENADPALRNLADFPNLTDQGENLLTSTDRENVEGDMPSVEVPTSDQPGVPAPKLKAKAGPAAKPAKSPSKASAPVSADVPPPKTARAPKAAAKTAPAPARSSAAPKKK